MSGQRGQLSVAREEPILQLRASDGVVLDVEKRVAMLSDTLKNMVEGSTVQYRCL